MTSETVIVATIDPSVPEFGNWVKGTVGDLTFDAKLFYEPSKSGIKKGCVSSLQIYDDKESGLFEDRCYVNYDRGWVVRVKLEYKAHYDAVMALLDKHVQLYWENKKQKND